jgi:hypothetical protein
MPRYKYIGKVKQNLAGVGLVTEGCIITVTAEQAAGLEKHAPEQFKLVPEVPVPAKTGQVAKPSAE